MTGRKVWRDAATLILTAKAPIRDSFAKTKSLNINLAAPEECSHLFDYKVLMLKRSSKSKFMPNAFVFPGGVIAGADSVEGWKHHFKDFGYTDDDLEELVLNNVDRPLLMKKADVNESISRDIALRLAAIRETFEESGVLLVKSERYANQSAAFLFENSSKLDWWRKQVHTSPDQLLSLYREVGAVPDLWGLKEWSDWLTPTDLNEQGRRRFDTIFYTASLNSIPTTMLDQAEVTAVQWTDPASLLWQFYQRKLWLAPPQVYELSRLLHFRVMEDLAKFSSTREQEGLTTWLPVRMECEDGMLSILPGDSLYPTNPDYVGTEGSRPGPYQGTMARALAETEQLNRLEFRDTYDCVTRVKGQSLNSHVHPLNYLEFQKSICLG